MFFNALFPMRVVKNTAESGEHNIGSSPRMLLKESSALYYSTFLHTSVIATSLPSGRTPSFTVLSVAGSRCLALNEKPWSF